MASSQPPPSAKPATAAITGLRALATRSQCAAKSSMKASMKDLSAISLMSAPAANAFSLPVMTMQPIWRRPRTPSSAALRSAMSAAFSALSACGRLSVMTPTAPRRFDEDGLIAMAILSLSAIDQRVTNRRLFLALGQ